MKSLIELEMNSISQVSVFIRDTDQAEQPGPSPVKDSKKAGQPEPGATAATSAASLS